ncbi:hypothetical protein THAOC_35221, partial [Thalassiosira oceanica]
MDEAEAGMLAQCQQRLVAAAQVSQGLCPVVGRPFLAHLVLRVRLAVGLQGEAVAQLVPREARAAAPAAAPAAAFSVPAVVGQPRQIALLELALVYDLLDGPGREHAVYEARLRLALSVDARHGLVVDRRVEIGVPANLHHDESIRAYQVQATPSGLARQEEREAAIDRAAVERIHERTAGLV